jgi:hypothetical protein
MILDGRPRLMLKLKLLKESTLLEDSFSDVSYSWSLSKKVGWGFSFFVQLG